VLACTDWPLCNGQWWPTMDWHHGFTLLRELGQGAGGEVLPFEALVAIHFAHRWFALVPTLLLLMLALQLRRLDSPTARRFAAALVALLSLQLLSGLSNVVLGWPLLAALGHSAGAAGLVLLLSLLLARAGDGAQRVAA
jgi:cytochrome c oxidase assembly protein subunit 15